MLDSGLNSAPIPVNSSNLDPRLGMFLHSFREGLVVRRVPMAFDDAWSLREGALTHKSGGFFNVVGARFDGREPCESVFLYQPQSAITGLLVKVENGVSQFLLHGRVEPGLVTGVEFAPTIQSTAANYLRLHGGKATPHIGWFTKFHPKTRIHSELNQMDFGNRYVMKTKRCSIIEVAGGECEESETHMWVTSDEVLTMISENFALDLDLRSLLASSSWFTCSTGFSIEPRSSEIRKSLERPLRDDVVGSLVSKVHGPPRFVRFVPMESLKNWQITDWGISEITPQEGYQIDFFETQTTSREVKTWVQPLINSRSPGQVSLYLRRKNETVEVLLRICHERGLPQAGAIQASFVLYPGKSVETSEEGADSCGGRILIGVEESDEGGRFFKDSSHYEIVEVEPDMDSGDGVWVSIAELKHLLSLSGLCTIQLRVVASLLLAVRV